MLRYVQERGNSTVYEWRTGMEPSVVERPRREEPAEPVEEDTVRAAPLGLGGGRWVYMGNSPRVTGFDRGPRLASPLKVASSQAAWRV